MDKSVADITRQFGLLSVRLFNNSKLTEKEYNKRYKLIWRIALNYLTNMQNNGIINPYTNVYDYLYGNCGEAVGSRVKMPIKYRITMLTN